MAFHEQRDLNVQATELRLGLPGTSVEKSDHQKQTSAGGRSNKRALPDMREESLDRENSNATNAKKIDQESAPPSK